MVRAVDLLAPEPQGPRLFFKTFFYFCLYIASLSLKLAKAMCQTVLMVMEVLYVSHGKSYRKGFLCESPDLRYICSRLSSFNLVDLSADQPRSARIATLLRHRMKK